MLSEKTDYVFLSTICTQLHGDIYTFRGKYRKMRIVGIYIICNFITVLL